MNIWSVGFDNKYNWYVFRETEDMDLGDFSKLFLYEKPLSETLPKDIVFFKWKAPDKKERNTILGDFMEGSGTDCGLVSERAKNLLELKYNKLFRFYSVRLEEMPEEKYYILEPTDYVFEEDVLDPENTEFKYLQDGDKDGVYGGERILMGVRRYTFTEEIRGHHFFWIIFNHGKIKMSHWMYCDDEFKEFIEKNKITGLKFTKIFEFED